MKLPSMPTSNMADASAVRLRKDAGFYTMSQAPRKLPMGDSFFLLAVSIKGPSTAFAWGQKFGKGVESLGLRLFSDLVNKWLKERVAAKLTTKESDHCGSMRPLGQ